MTTPLDDDPRELIRLYYPLEGALEPLVELLRVNPHLAEQVVVLAMALGIHAQTLRETHDREMAALSDGLSTLKRERELSFWRGQS